MTRINTIDPAMLSDQHLMAEYRELPRIFTAVRKLGHNSPSAVDMPSTYKLGPGHVKFFYNKLAYIYRRWNQCVNELHDRNFSLNPDLINSIKNDYYQMSDIWKQDWMPKPRDHYLNMARLAKRSNMSAVLQELKSAN